MEKTLARKRVLIIKNTNILGAAIESLLEGYCQHEIKTILLNDQQAIEKELALFHPDIVITDEKTVLKHLLGIADCLQTYPSLRLVILNPDNNKVQVFDKHQFQVQGIEDFLSVL